MSSATLVLLQLVLWFVACVAHIPYLELEDFTEEEPFRGTASIETSAAVYAFLESDSDADYYQWTVEAGEQVYASLLVPVCPEYEDFMPSMAVIGPGLPELTTADEEILPSGGVTVIEEGDGVVVLDNSAAERSTLYEPFGGKQYYEFDAKYDSTADQGGVYKLIVWDPVGNTGDYVAVAGRREDGDFDWRTWLTTWQIRRNRELHVSCRPCRRLFRLLRLCD